MKTIQAFGERIQQAITNFFQHSRKKKLIVLLVYFFFVCLIIYSNRGFRLVMLEPDEVATRTIQSNVQATIVDETETEALRAEAEAQVLKSYREDTVASDNAEKEVSDFFDRLEDIMDSDPELTDQWSVVLLMVQGISGSFSNEISDEMIARYLYQALPEERLMLREVTISAVEIAMDKPITEEAVIQVRSDFHELLAGQGLVASAEALANRLGVEAIVPNLIYDEQATIENREKARQAVQPVYKMIKVGEIIVREGDRVTAEQIDILEKIGMQKGSSYDFSLLGIMLLVALFTALTLVFINRYYPSVFQSDKMLLLIALIVVLFLLIGRFLMALNISDDPKINILSGYMAPAAAAAMLFAILLEYRLAYFLSIIFAIYLGLVNQDNQLSFMIAAFASSIVGIQRVGNFGQMGDLVKAGGLIALVNTGIVLALCLINPETTLQIILIGMLMGALSGVLSAVFTIGALPYLESAFAITSTIKLLELSNPNHPLLKRLFLEAPGTYHHSLMVASLAETTAELINANALLARVGAYYHDIGKMRRPEYYVENQRGSLNPHEKIAPALSSLIVLSHVKEGLELAKESRLPPEITAFIASHHGTGLTEYFYNKATLEDGKENVNPANYRYSGPIPKTKEVALVMLADSTEAAVRSLPDPSKDKIKLMVHNIIKGKLYDGQLDESELTLKDLDVIADRFCVILEGIYHKRIQYPDANKGR